MKKILSLVMLFFIIMTNISFSFADCKSVCDAKADSDYLTCMIGGGGSNTTAYDACVSVQDAAKDACTESCNPTTKTVSDDATVNGITIGEKCLTNGQCKFDIYETLGIRKSITAEGQDTSVGLFVQDIVLSATFFIGTIVTIALVVSGLMYIFAAASGKDPSDAKKGIIGALIGLVIVACSYFIIRLVQYLAKGF